MNHKTEYYGNGIDIRYQDSGWIVSNPRNPWKGIAIAAAIVTGILIGVAL